MYHVHTLAQNPRIIADAPLPTPSQQALRRAHDIWERLTAERPGLFNARIFSLKSFQDGVAHGFMAEYMWYAAQYEDPTLFPELRVRARALNGVLTARGHVFFGLRRPHLAIESGLWELVPSGTLSDAALRPDGSLDWASAFAAELREELGVSLDEPQPHPFALVENSETNIWELGVAARIDADHRDILASWAALEATEHSELAAVPSSDVARFFKQRGPAMTGVTGPLLAAYGLA